MNVAWLFALARVARIIIESNPRRKEPKSLNDVILEKGSTFH